MMNRPGLYHLATKFAPLAQQFHPLVQGTPLDPMGAWTKTRDFPEAAAQSFSAWMKIRQERTR